MEREYEVGQHIIFVDSRGRSQDAIVTAWWGDESQMANYSMEKPGEPMPGVNLVIVSNDVKKDDPYGRQIERECSVVHKSQQPAHGNYWMWPDK